MKRTILYQNGKVVEYAFVPESDLVLAKSAYIAQIQSPKGHAIDVYMPKNGVPVLLVASVKEAMSQFDMPSYEELEQLCEEQAFVKYGQAHTIADALGQAGVCSFAKANKLRKTIEENLIERNYLVFVDENIATGFNEK